AEEGKAQNDPPRTSLSQLLNRRNDPCAVSDTFRNMSSSFENEFRASATKLTADLRHRALIRASLKGYEKNRDEKRGRFQSWESARQAAAETKWEAINHLDSYLSKFADNLEKRGARVFWAGTAEEARNYILNLAREKQAKTIVKSKTMTSEEIHLNEAL